MSEIIKAILYESSRVLTYPVTGHWFIPPNFFNIIDKRAYDRLHDIEIDAAFAQAAEIFPNYPRIPSKEAELSLFLEYYQILFACLRVLKITSDQIEQVARDIVFNPDKFAFYPDGLNVIPSLSANYKLAVVSDAWPSLEDVFTKAGLHQHFSTFVLSSVLGVSLPDKRMYKTALNDLGIAPREAVVVDDSKKNCDAAHRLGLRTVLLCRDKTLYGYYRLTSRSHCVIHSLNDLPGCLSGKL